MGLYKNRMEKIRLESSLRMKCLENYFFGECDFSNASSSVANIHYLIFGLLAFIDYKATIRFVDFTNYGMSLWLTFLENCDILLFYVANKDHNKP